MKNNFCARKVRQLKYRIKLLKNKSRVSGINRKTQQLIDEINNLVQYLKYSLPKRRLRKIIGGAAVLLGLSFGTTVNAQQFGPRQENPFGIIPTPPISVPALADLDGDGDLDLLSGVYDGFFEFAENIGNAQDANFDSPINSPFGLPSIFDFSFPTIADLDNDGDFDVLTFTGEDNAAYFENNGDINNPSFSSAVDAFGIQTPEFMVPKFVDIDNDGDFDLFGGAGENIVFFENIGDSTNPQFGTEQSNPFGIDTPNGEALYLVPAFADLDLDGDLDILSVDYYGVFYYHENIGDVGNPSFGPITINPFGLAPLPLEFLTFLEFGDLDGDGDADLITSTTNGPVGYYELLGTISSTTEFIAADLVKIFPNPTRDLLNIQSKVEFETLEVFDLLGRSLIKENYTTNSINTAQLQNGNYILKLTTTDNQLLVKKFGRFDK